MHPALPAGCEGSGDQVAVAVEKREEPRNQLANLALPSPETHPSTPHFHLLSAHTHPTRTLKKSCAGSDLEKFTKHVEQNGSSSTIETV